MNPYLVLLYGQHECWSYVHCTHWPECMYVRVRLSPVTPVNSSYDLPLDLPSSFHAPGQSCLAVKPSNNGSTAGAEVWNHLRQSVWSATTACQLKWKLSCTSNKLSDSCPELLTSDSYFNLYFHFVTLVMLDQSSLCRLGTKYFVDVGSGCCSQSSSAEVTWCSFSSDFCLCVCDVVSQCSYVTWFCYVSVWIIASSLVNWWMFLQVMSLSPMSCTSPHIRSALMPATKAGTWTCWQAQTSNVHVSITYDFCHLLCVGCIVFNVYSVTAVKVWFVNQCSSCVHWLSLLQCTGTCRVCMFTGCR